VNIVKNKCVNDVVIIDGLTRTGKFFLGKLVSSINGLEYFINSSEVERIIAISKSGTLIDADASALLVIAMNESIYSMAIGRNLNMRHDDGSSVLNSFEKELYINRQDKGHSGHKALNEITNQKRSSVFIMHQSLQSASVIKDAVPQSRIINLRRHPVDLVYSWIKRGWGKRYGSDLLSFEPVYYHNGSMVPYFAVEWADEYLASNEHDRVIKSIINLTEEESNVIESKKYDICCIYYENLVEQTHKEMGKICTFLNSSPHESMAKTIEREARYVDFQEQRKMKIDYISSGIEDKTSFEKLLNLGSEYENNINNEKLW